MQRSGVAGAHSGYNLKHVIAQVSVGTHAHGAPGQMKGSCVAPADTLQSRASEALESHGLNFSVPQTFSFFRPNRGDAQHLRSS